MENFTVFKLYTAIGCSRCGIVKHMLKSNNVEYEEISNKDVIKNLGIEFVPAIQIEDKIIDEYVDVLHWLDSNGYYSLEEN